MALVEVVAGNFLAVDFCSVLGVAGGIEDGIEASQGQQHDDDADDCFGNPAL